MAVIRLSGLLLISCCDAILLAKGQQPLRVSLPLARPMGYREANGTPRGFVVEALNAAAERAKLTLSWREVGDMKANNSALESGQLDIVAGLNTAERRRRFFVTDAWWSFDVIVLFPPAKPIRQESELDGRRVAVPPGVGPDVAARYPGSSIVSVGTAVEAAEAVCKGSADAAVIQSMYLRELLFAASPVCAGVSLETLDSKARVDFVLIANEASAEAARSLRKALDAITADGTLATIASRHPPLSTPYATKLGELLSVEYQRQVWLIFSASGAVILFLGILFTVKQVRARERLSAAVSQLNEDLLARQRAETAQRKSEARFRALFDSAPQTVIAIDRAGRIAFANRKSQEMFGRPDLVGVKVEKLLAERFRATVRDGFSQVRNLTGLRADGREFPIEIHCGAVETEDELTLAFITDVSDRSELQQQLLQSQKLESVGQLAGGIAHDFNNLLTVIGGYSEILLTEAESNPALHEPLKQISGAADRAAALTRQLLTFSRRQRTKPKILSLNDLLRNLQKMLDRLIGEDIELILITNEIGLICADAGHIEQVVINLAVNSRDAMVEGGRLVIETSRFHVDPAYGSGHAGIQPGDYVMLRVNDTGSGMPPEVQARIFEPFFTTKEQGKGTGLGLSTVYGIVKQSGGEVLVYSQPGQGTTFKILLPVTEGEVQDDIEAPHATSPKGDETILLAEDEPGVRRFVKDVLTSNGYTVLEAVNGREALEIAARHTGPIHLLLSDMVMPQVGGVELAENLKGLHPGSFVLHMSGYSDRRIQPEASGLIEKPFTPSALLQLVRATLDGQAAQTTG